MMTKSMKSIFQTILTIQALTTSITLAAQSSPSSSSQIQTNKNKSINTKTSSSSTTTTTITSQASSTSSFLPYAECKLLCKDYASNKLSAKVCNPALNVMPRPGVYKACNNGRLIAFEHACMPSCTGEEYSRGRAGGTVQPGSSYHACQAEAKKPRPNNQMPWCRQGYDTTFREVTKDIGDIVRDIISNNEEQKDSNGEENDMIFLGSDVSDLVDNDGEGVMLLETDEDQRESRGNIDNEIPKEKVHEPVAGKEMGIQYENIYFATKEKQAGTETSKDDKKSTEKPSKMHLQEEADNESANGAHFERSTDDKQEEYTETDDALSEKLSSALLRATVGYKEERSTDVLDSALSTEEF